MPYWRLFYHLVWSTRHRQPLLTPDVETVIHGFLRSKAIGLGATVYALNGVENHVHMVVSIPPSIAVATFVGQVKGSSSARFNKSHLSETSFSWQEEYVAFSFDANRLPNYIDYVKRQKEHHAEGRTIPVLERCNSSDSAIREATPEYLPDEFSWWQELTAMSEEAGSAG